MHIDVQAMLDSLSIMGFGMSGIFIVILFIMLMIKLLSLVGKDKSDYNNRK